MAQRDDSGITPTRADAGVTTAPTLSAADEISELRAELSRLKGLLGAQDRSLSQEMTWPDAITYDAHPYSGARLTGITKDRQAVRPTTDFQGLPEPTTDEAQLETDFVRWGYCIVKDALSNDQVQRQIDRLQDQAAAERSAGVAKLSHHGCAQMVFNILPKGQVFRDLIALEESAIDEAPLIERLLEKILGQSFYLGTAHGSIVHQGGGRQELHQDQGYVPLPHPPYPLACLIIYSYTNFSLEEGATYIVPGSHRDASGANLVNPDDEYENLAKGKLKALTVPAGCAVLTDSRMLHSGGARSAAGTRLASRLLYIRGFMRQQENQLAAMTDEMLDSLSPKLKGLIGFKSHYGLGMVDGNSIDPSKPKIQVGELSMSRPEEFEQDFDWRYSKIAKMMSEADWESHVDYRGPQNGKE
jgi:ectoine hydroxylase-related dioxygenase (phytanoyl-CoA dioxygenase family)